VLRRCPNLQIGRVAGQVIIIEIVVAIAVMRWWWCPAVDGRVLVSGRDRWSCRRWKVTLWCCRVG
jgi:hypothetical protein